MCGSSYSAPRRSSSAGVSGESLAGRFEIIPATHWQWDECREAFGWDVDTFVFHGGYPGAAPLVALLSLFGGSIAKLSIVGLGVYPYITASIVMQLLQPIIPALKKMGTEDGEAGRNRLAQITRYLTIPLAFLQSLAGSEPLCQHWRGLDDTIQSVE